jgi:peptide chain release factor 3
MNMGPAARFEHITLYKTAWITSTNKAMLEDFKARKSSYIALDKEGRDVFLADSPYALTTAMEKYPDIRFHFTSEF